jgi:hypothetical protein
MPSKGGRVDAPARGDGVVGPSMVRIGRVADLAPGRFLLETRDGRRLWMKGDCVFTVDEGVVTLICEQDRLPEYTAPAPGDARTA